jgi:hypothetical protein
MKPRLRFSFVVQSTITLAPSLPEVKADGYHTEPDGTMVGDHGGGVQAEDRVETVPAKPIQRDLRHEQESREGSDASGMTYEDIQRGIREQGANERRSLLKRFCKQHPGTSERAKQAIFKRQIFVGMSSDEAEASWGAPERKHRSVGSWGIHEQWVYGNQYLYFEDGKLSSWQE